MLRLLKLLRRKVAPTERPSGSDIAGSDGATELTGQRFDLDDVGAETSQQLGGVGECLHLFDGQHADTFERSSCCGHRTGFCRSELHVEYYIRTVDDLRSGRSTSWSVSAP